MTEEKTIPMRFKELEETIKLQKQVIEKQREALKTYRCMRCIDGEIKCYDYEACRVLEETDKLLEGLE